MDKIICESPWMTIVDKAGDTVEINIEGIIGGSFWEEEGDDSLNTKEKMRAELKAIGAAKAKKIIVNINSYGGDVNHGISIFDMLAQSKAEVTTRVNGFTASIATVIAMAGSSREMSANSLFLIHKPSLIMIGGFNENELAKRTESLQKVDGRIRAIYEKGGVERSVIDDLMEENSGQGKWIDSEEAQDFGFITDEFEPMKMAACIDQPELLNQMGISNIPNKYIDMSNETSKVKEMFDNLKTWMVENNIIKPPAAEGEEGKVEPAQEEIMVAPKELAEKMEAIQAAIDAVESDEEAVAQVETLTNEKTELEKSITTLTADNTTQKQKITELEGKLVKKNGGSTTVEGPEGIEDPDNAVLTGEQKTLKADLASLRNEFEVTHG